MKKKMIFGAAACMIAALSVVGLNANKTNSSNVTLSDLVMTSEANAEWIPEYAPDAKLLYSGNCVLAVGYRQCNYYGY